MMLQIVSTTFSMLRRYSLSLARMKLSRANFITTGDFPAKFRASARASSSTWPRGTARLTSPRAAASVAAIGRPENNSSKARWRPIWRGRWTKCIAGISPTSISG